MFSFLRESIDTLVRWLNRPTTDRYPDWIMTVIFRGVVGWCDVYVTSLPSTLFPG